MTRKHRTLVLLCFLFCGLCTAPVAGLIADGLLAEYDFKQGANATILYDISGNGHNGMIYGASWTDKGLAFNGTSDYINIGDLGSLRSGYTVITAVKANTDHFGVILNRISGTTPTDNVSGFVVKKTTTANQFRLSEYDGMGPTYLKRASDTTGVTGEWAVVTARYNGSAISCSVNAGLPTQTAAGFKEHNGDYVIGRLSYTSKWWLNGDLAYLAVYNRSLSDKEVAQIYLHLKDNLSDREISLPDPPRPVRPMIAITLDDGWETDYTGAYPLAAARGIPLTSYVITGCIGTAGRLSWEQIYELRAAGWDIECHTQNHPNLQTLSDAEIRTQMEAVNTKFTSAGLPVPEHHAYPGGSCNERVQAVISEYRVTGRTTHNSTACTISDWEQEIDWYNLRGRYIYKTQRSSIDDIKALIDNAIAKNQVLILYTHKVTAEPGQYDCYIDLFEEILDYIVSKGDAIDVMTMDGIYRAMQGIRTYPVTVPMTLHGGITEATYDKAVGSVGFVWGGTRKGNPERAAPMSSGYDNCWVSSSGNFTESDFTYTVANISGGQEYYYRAAANIDGAWYYGEELTYISEYPCANFSANVTAGYAPLAVNLMDTSTGNVTAWVWNFGDGTNSTEQHPIHTYTMPGNFTVSLTVSNEDGENTITQMGYISVQADVDTNTISVLPASSTMTVSQTQAYTLMLDNASFGLAGYNVTVLLTNSSVGEITGVQYPPWASLPVNDTVPADVIRCQAADLSGTSGTVNITLVTVTIRADTAGSTNVTVLTQRVEDRLGGRYESATTDASITVMPLTPFPSPAGGTFPPPTDQNSDGIYEDLDGNDWIGFNDIIVYYNNLEEIDSGTYGPVSFYDYDGNGWAGFNDIVRLYGMIA